MLVTCQEMADAEARLFATGVEAEPLMEKAGLGCARAIRDFYRGPGRAVLFCGKGNNGGDALVAGRWLRQWGWNVSVDLSHDPAEMTDLARKKLEELSSFQGGSTDVEGSQFVLVDGLLGIGAKGAIRGKIRDSADRLNGLRREENGDTFAIDIPSGLDGDTGEPFEGAVIADLTLSICAPKRGIAGDGAVNHVGRIVEIPLPEIPVDSKQGDLQLLLPSNLRPRLPRRDFDFHKGKAGRLVIVAGSRGLSGAPVLSSLGASHSGAGLTSLLVPENIYSIVASTAPAEVMVRPFSSINEISDFEADVLAIGPGLGKEMADQLVELIANDPRPAVIDADALNALSRKPELLGKLPEGKRMLTPHPGELKRLSGKTGDRVSLTRDLATEWGVTLLHKGARTVIATPGKPVALNTSGHPGMASGGMGDVLTGVCASLLGQGLGMHDAACVGSWILGRAAEIAVRDEGISRNSVTAVSVANRVGCAFSDLENSVL